ncbi:3-methylcrotonyl-CoA carboxylase [Achromobacter marplatensis]|uniref:3-methylcrotonoyl-CoA carboxylase alpha subunit /biotin carboxylase /acetyl-CoA carboxylase carboxyltransferase subunit alpha n=1 Tax=Achromobacter marplatensis TaxID=470868 RepID=A0ABX9GG56_9BURK|nr:acetyl/propionyl/methylcrotonyl-CoA carboxylase subunit alpha [Achromobacter marplatensis]OWT66693.1 3-methylcrotonyl-CoA carboxylase [Achromobacter marplatensis]RBP21469.1 3-methylcrotonoyl-CoA carboxylase alpha subunit /biotin carboxylase /acetyl-CoA carboxylase carboxyltransferase subunit alpha [Achromobacter marplatensis]CAB3639373.1 Acetyl-/propionyl-coenzyme A carboxylase alpha chain [Achromobacter marplatensis]
MFDTLLIANRGEIACRVAATARRMGIRTVAVYSDADANARHVAACDQAVHIGGPEPRASYLRADAILQAAIDTGAGAIHPGYGFLSENEAFAEAAEKAGISFVGPPASAIAAMGSKSAAKSLMEKAGVPLVPGYHGDNQDPQFLKTQADGIGYPVLIKASAGGGGKGMRVVESSGAFLDALASCQREAASSFGDDRVLIERYLQKPRHIEIQVFADTHGNCVYLFERDCSVQRRHQKVIEEAPAPGMTEERRRAMGEAAVAAARAVGYVGAGTVEFIAEPDGRFYFMEMNTRLQVEHPVTEMITGHDLVEWQLRVAAGQPLPVRQEDLRINGHAIEVRIYAENPEKGFLPSIGTLAYLGLPPHTAFTNGDIRVDGGVRTGDTITPFYDPMIAKLIVHGADRDQARARMLQALAQTQAVGVQTNVAFLSRLMQDSAFAAADLDTGLIERQRATLLPEPQAASAATLALASAAVLVRQGLAQPGPQTAGKGPSDPWDARDGWRLGNQYQRHLQWVDNGETRRVTVARQGGAWTLDAGSGAQPFLWRSHASANPNLAYGLRITLAGHENAGTVVLHADRAHVFGEGGVHVLELYDPLAHAQDTQGEHGGGLTAPMPGKIISISVKAGDTVEKGQPLLVMEAMKMEHTISAPADGRVGEVFYGVGDQVTEGAELVSIDA